MKLIIDIPEKIEEYIKDYIPIGAGDNVFCYPDEIVRMIQNGTPIPNNATNGEWVDVNERLPEEYGEYLITWKNPKYPKTYIGICECEITDVYDHEHNRFEVEWLFDGYITTAYPDSYVVAWQPLPEPYQKGGKE